jgi:cytochrome P450
VTAIAFEFDAYSPQVSRDPYPFYARMRAEHPVLWCETTRAWALSRYDDVLAALLDPGTFSSAQGNVVNDNPARAGKTLGTTDPPRHDQLRKLVNDAFARRTVGDYEAPMRALATEVLDAAPRNRQIDLRDVLAGPSSAAVLGEVLGVDNLNRGDLAAAFVTVLDDPPRLGTTGQARPGHDAAMATVLEVVRETIALRRRHPGTDVVSTLIDAGLDDDELLWIMFTFLGAGLESSTGQFLLAALNLARFPDQRARLVEEPSLIPTAYEELVRFDCGPQRFHRTLTRDVELHGATMRAGDSVLVMYGSANRDERYFDRADELLVERYPNKHLGFGRGPHFCLGAPLARLQGQVLFEVLLAAAPDYAVAPDDELQWKINPGFRGVRRLPVVLERGA